VTKLITRPWLSVWPWRSPYRSWRWALSDFGLFFHFVPSSIAPMAMWIRSLALLCSVLLALPPGWCCMVGSAPCCNQCQPVKNEKVPSTHPSSHKSCCCSSETTEQNSNCPAPSPKPSTPVKPCCCEKAPSSLPEGARLLPDLFVVPLAVLVELPFSNGIDRAAAGPALVDTSPALHVLHCVWLC
jgi:hypothetical protein